MRMLTTFFPRLWRALLLDPSLYDEVRDDRKAIWQAVVIVLVASISLNVAMVHIQPGPDGESGAECLSGWLVWAFLLQRLAPRLFRTGQPRPTYLQVLRPLGFAFAPVMLSVLGIPREIRATMEMLMLAWFILSMSSAVKQSLGYSSRKRAAAAFICCGLVMLLVLFGVGILLGWLASVAGLEGDAG